MLENAHLIAGARATACKTCDKVQATALLQHMVTETARPTAEDGEEMTHKVDA